LVELLINQHTLVGKNLLVVQALYSLKYIIVELNRYVSCINEAVVIWGIIK